MCFSFILENENRLVAAGALLDAQNGLLENGTGRETPLHRAAIGGHLTALLRLLSAGARVIAAVVVDRFVSRDPN